MLGKLLKYDFRSMWKQFSVIWPAALILAFLNRFTMFGMDNPGGSAFGEWMGVISMGLFGGVCFTMVILSAVFVLTRFYKGLLGDEGYLMHTLPVRSWQLVLSRLICALATTVVNGIVGILAMFLMMPLNWDEIFDTQLWQAVFRNLVQQPDIILYFLEFLLLLLVMCAAMFMNFYLAMSIGHLFSRRRILMSVVAFFGLNILDSVITSTLHNMDMMNWLYGMDLSDHAGYWLGILLLLIPTVIMFLLTSWILKHKLNLE